MNLEALSSTVLWPASFSHDPKDGEHALSGLQGGTLVYAIWRDENIDSFIPDAIPLEFKRTRNILAGVEGPLAAELKANPNGITVTTVVAIGGSESSIEIFGEEHELFSVTRSELTEKGQRILEALEELHGGQATLVTYHSDERWV
jgi:hypothetical protein